MKPAINIVRIIVGILFIFSGMIKAIDPLGLAYKMQEFFEVWAKDGYIPGLMMYLYKYALAFALVMITLEVLLGVALLLGYAKKLVTWLLLLLIIFFTFLTSYVLFTGKIRACGCFGDCIPLTPVQTFIKDIILLLCIIILLIKRNLISNVLKPFVCKSILFITLLLMAALQWYVLHHLPLIDCLPYKKGNNILELRKMPADAVPDKFDYIFIYEKGGEKKEFAVSALPDSTWKFVDRKQTLVQKGKNNIPLINDFFLRSLDGNDSITAILSQPGEYYLFFINDFNKGTNAWSTAFVDLWQTAKDANRNLYIVTAQPAAADTYFNQLNKFGIPVFTCDATAIKTAARVLPAVF
ncbi:MAG: DoxX family membrane protein [Chitinophagaceae bacterium]|nr:DoxX family membrane protein [Chitinophagaceae bacterium]